VSPHGLIGAIIAGSLRHRFVVLGLSLILVGYGVIQLRSANYDVFPDFAPPRAAIQTEAPGLSAEQVETLVTRPIETQIIGVPGLASIRSNSIQGLSDITVVFNAATDIFRARQQLSEVMVGLRQQLPDGIGDPRLTPLTSSTGTVLIAGLTSRTVSAMELRTVADWTIRPRLLAVPGVAQVSVYGGFTKQYQIAVDPYRLARFAISIEEVVAAARRTLGVRGAGFIDNANQRVVIEASDNANQRVVIEASDNAPTIERLASTVVAQNDGHRLTLGEIATVEAAPAPPIGAALIDGAPGLELFVSSQYGANTVKVAAGVDRAIKELSRELTPQGIVLRNDLFRPAGFIETALGNLEFALLLGGALVIAVVFLFLWNFRMAAIALTAIPLSLLAGIIAIDELGYSLNTMTLGGLGIAVGLLVDDAVIVVENVYRRLRQNKAASTRPSITEVIAAATFEVRSAVVYATLAIALIFVPVLTMQDVAGRLFGPLGLAYIFATLASLLTALTVTPALCSLLIDPDRLPDHEPRLTHWLKSAYRKLLALADLRLLWVMAVVVGASAAIFSLVPRIGTSFIPQLKEGHYVMRMALVPGSSLDATTRVGKEIAKALLKAPHVRLVAQRTGRAENTGEPFGTNSSELDVDLEPTDARGQAQTEAAIRNALREIPGATFAVMTFLSDRLDEEVSGYTAPLIARAVGADLDALDKAAAQIAAAIETVPEAVDVERIEAPAQQGVLPQLYEQFGNAGRVLLPYGSKRRFCPAGTARDEPGGDGPLRRAARGGPPHPSRHGEYDGFEYRCLCRSCTAEGQSASAAARDHRGVRRRRAGAGRLRPLAADRFGARRRRDGAAAVADRGSTAQFRADPAQSSVRHGRRRPRASADGRRRVSGRAGRLRHPVRNYPQECDHDGLPLRPSDARRGPYLGSRHRDRGRRGSPVADSDDHSGDGARLVAAGARQRRARPRDRGPNGGRHSRRVGELGNPKPPCVAGARAPLRPLRKILQWHDGV